MNLLLIEDLKSMTIAQEASYKKNKAFYDCLNVVQVESFRKLVIETLNDSGTAETLHDAVEVTRWLIFLLENDKMLSENMNSYFIDLLIVSSLLHNLTYKYGEEDWTLMFKTRSIIERVNKDKNINVPENYLKSIYIPIDSQLGKDMPIEVLIPNPNTPGSQVALACSLHYKKRK